MHTFNLENTQISFFAARMRKCNTKTFDKIYFLFHSWRFLFACFKVSNHFLNWQPEREISLVGHWENSSTTYYIYKYIYDILKIMSNVKAITEIQKTSQKGRSGLISVLFKVAMPPTYCNLEVFGSHQREAETKTHLRQGA